MQASTSFTNDILSQRMALAQNQHLAVMQVTDKLWIVYIYRQPNFLSLVKKSSKKCVLFQKNDTANQLYFSKVFFIRMLFQLFLKTSLFSN